MVENTHCPIHYYWRSRILAWSMSCWNSHGNHGMEIWNTKNTACLFGIHAITLLLLSGIVFFLQTIHHPMGSIIAFPEMWDPPLDILEYLVSHCFLSKTILEIYSLWHNMGKRSRDLIYCSSEYRFHCHKRSTSTLHCLSTGVDVRKEKRVLIPFSFCGKGSILYGFHKCRNRFFSSLATSPNRRRNFG